MSASTSKAADSSSEDEASEGDELVGETDAERREALLHSATSEDAPTKTGGISWGEFEDEFDFTGRQIIEISSDEDIPIASGSTFTMPPPKQKTTPRDLSKGGLFSSAACSNVTIPQIPRLTTAKAAPPLVLVKWSRAK